MSKVGLRRQGSLRSRLIAGAVVSGAFVLGAPAAQAAPTWLPSQQLSGAHAGTQQSVDVAPDGTVVAVWSESDGSHQRIKASIRPPGGSFSAPVFLSAAGQAASNPAVAIDRTGRAVAVWQRSNGVVQIIQAAARPAGGQFGGPQDIPDNATSALDPDVAISDDGTAIVAWNQGGVPKAVVRAPSGSLGAPATLGPSGLSSSLPNPTIDVEMNGKGDAIIGWVRATFFESNYRPAGGSFQAVSQAVSGADGNPAYFPSVAIDVAGHAVAGWQTFAPARSYVASRDAGAAAVWDGVQNLHGDETYLPKVAIDDQSTAIAVFSHHEPGGYRVEYSVRPFGQGFTTPIAVSAPGLEASYPTVEFDPAGNAVAVWNRRTPGGTFEIQASIRPRGGGFGAVTRLTTGGGVYAHLAGLGTDERGNYFVSWVRNDGAKDVVEGAAFDGGAPSQDAVTVPATGTAGQSIGMSISASDVWSSFTTSWDFGDGRSASGTAVSHTYAVPGTYTVTATTTDAVGNATSTSRVIQVAAPPAVDADKDGVPVPQDCNDNNPGIRPGTFDTPNNGVDEDCAGGDAVLKLSTTFSYTVRFFKRFTRFTSLIARNDVPAGATIRLSCSGRSCPFRVKRIRQKKAAKAVSLTKYMGRTVRIGKGKRKRKRFIAARLRVGVKVEARITLKNAIGRYRILTIRSNKAPRSKEGCLAPTTSAKVSC